MAFATNRCGIAMCGPPKSSRRLDAEIPTPHTNSSAAKPNSNQDKPLAHALQYAARGWSVFPVGKNKRPLTKHGFQEATLDPEQIRAWWLWSPRALIAVATGRPSGIVGLDIDVKQSRNGLVTLELLGVGGHPTAPTAHTPSGGLHILFGWPGFRIPCSTDKLGPGLDVRGDGGYLVLPPGPGRSWDPHLGPDTALPPLPQWIVARCTSRQQQSRRRPSFHRSRLTPYGRAALDDAVRRIRHAAAGQQELTLNSEAFRVARLVGRGLLPAEVAYEALVWAAHQMPTYDPHRPWRTSEIDRKVRRSFSQGLDHRGGRR
jgi:hypothetical protein